MGPVEGFYLAIAGIVLLIGMARGYKRELGNTLVFIGAVLIFAAIYDVAWEPITAAAASILPDESAGLVLSALFNIVFLIIVFSSYAGNTLDFQGQSAPAPGGFIISLLVGMLNGYLVAGTFWFFQAIFNYPIRRIFDWFLPVVPECQAPALIANDLTAATACVNEFIINDSPLMWPPVLFPNPVFWAIPLAIMIILKVRG